MSKAVKVDVKIDETSVQNFLFAPGRGIVTERLTRLARRVAARAKQFAPVDTGRLRSTIRATEPRRKGIFTSEAGVEATAKHALWVHEGTRPHVIKPKSTGGVIAFTAGGELVFTKRVQHPGTKANPFLRRALEVEQSRID